MMALPLLKGAQPDHPAAPKTRWISGLVAGAGKLISSVFASPDTSDSDTDADQDAPPLPLPLPLPADHNQHDALSPKNLHTSIQQNGQGLLQDSKTIVPLTTKSKITIHQLIAKETFTREESEKLIKLIESRVVESSDPNRQQKDVYSQTLEFSQFSPVQISPEMRSVAIAESKKWLEEKKKSAPSSSKTVDLGPCKLNTDMSLFETESDIGSPVELAKSYMHSKPPWQSPFLTSSSTLFGTPSTGSSKFSSGFNSGTFDHSLSSSRLLKRDYFSTGLWDPKEESSRRVRSRLSGTAFDSISNFTRPGSVSRLFDSNILDSHKNLNLNLLDGNEPANTGFNITSSQAGTAEGLVNTSEPTPENNLQGVTEKEQRITKETAVDLNKETEGILEVVNLETSNPVLTTLSEEDVAGGQDPKILTEGQPDFGNKGAPEPKKLSDPNTHGEDLHITNSLHGSTNKNSANGPAVQSNMESEFESSINGGRTSSTGGPDVSDNKSLNDSTQTASKTLEPGMSHIRKGRKQVASGRSRGRGRGRGRGT